MEIGLMGSELQCGFIEHFGKMLRRQRLAYLFIHVVVGIAFFLGSIGCGRPTISDDDSVSNENNNDVEYVYYEGTVHLESSTSSSFKVNPIPLVWSRSINSAGNVNDSTLILDPRPGTPRREFLLTGLIAGSSEEKVAEAEGAFTGLGSFEGDRWSENVTEYDLMTSDGKTHFTMRITINNDSNTMSIRQEYAMTTGEHRSVFSGTLHRIDKEQYQKALDALLHP